jgi:hypothetical protein
LKGATGNPGGRPVEDAEVKQLARAQGPSAIARLTQLMYSEDERTCVAAAQALLNRGFGKAESTSTLDVTLSQKPKIVYPAWEDMDVNQVSGAYMDLMKAGDEGREIEFLPPRPRALTPVNLWEEMMKPTPEETARWEARAALRRAEEAYNDVLAGKPTSIAPKPLAVVPTTSERAIPVPRRPQEATAAGRAPESRDVGPSAPEISHRRPLDSDGLAPRGLAREDWSTPDHADRSLVLVVEAPAALTTDHPDRDKHVCKPHPDAVRACCRHLWVIS